MKLKYIAFPIWFSCILLVAACSDDSSNGASEVSGQGGSMARFAIKDDVLYVVDNSTLKLFDIQNEAQPRYLQVKEQKLDFGIETIFIRDSLLFIGSETGMYIYNVKRPDFPQYLSSVSHIRSCDPVVANGNYAYVTLNTASTRCNRGTNELQVYDISNPRSPVLRTTIPMNSPKGLGVGGNKLFVCDRGLKVYDISNPVNPDYVDDNSSIPEIGNIDAYDVIPRNGVLLLTGRNGLYQIDYTGEKLKFLSKIEVESHE